MQAEEKIYPPTVFTGEGVEEPYDCYIRAVKLNKIGDTVVHHAAAPGTGSISYRITRIDETGVYAEEISNNIRELQPWEVE